MIFWNKNPAIEQPRRINCAHHRIIVENSEKTSILSPAEFEKAFKIVYLPHIEFPRWADFVAISRKTLKYRKKGLLDQKQLWLGAYFQKELQMPPAVGVRLRWIDDTLGWGVFAEQDLMPMHYIGEYAGIVRRKKRSDAKNAYCFEYSIVSDESTRYTIDAMDQGGIVRFINHSSTPNLTSALATYQNLSHIVIFARRLIKKGEQLCYDYGPAYWSKRTLPQKLGLSD